MPFQGILAFQQLATLIDNYDILRKARGDRNLRSRPIALTRFGATVFADVLKCDAIVDCREGRKFHGGGIRNHVCLSGCLRRGE